MLKFKALLLIALTGEIGVLNSPGLTQISSDKILMSSRILKEAKANNKLNWGLRTVSPPISYQDNYGQWQGFCTNFISLLENYLKDNQLVKNDFKIERYGISLENRFTYTRFPAQPNHQLRLAGECGSDTTKQAPDGIKFSFPYYKTKTLLLIRKNKANKFSFLNQHFNFYNTQKAKIGVFNGSVTGDRVKRYFDSSEVDIVNIKGGTREAGISIISNGEVDALASSEIFLNKILEVLNKKEDEFYVDPQWVISRETYGLILPGDDEGWVKIINQFLIKEQKNIQILLNSHLGSRNVIEYYNIKNAEEKTFNQQWMFILLIFLGIIVFSLVYKYWIIRRQSSILTKSNFGTLDLSHSQNDDPYAIAIAFEQLAEKNPDAQLKIVGMEIGRKDKLLLRAETAPNANKSELNTEYFSTYNQFKGLPKEQIRSLLIEKNIQLEEQNSLIVKLESMVIKALQFSKVYSETYIQKVENMSHSPGSFSVGGSFVGNASNVQGDRNRIVQSDDNQAVLGDNNQVTQRSQAGTDSETPLTKEGIVKVLTELETLIRKAELPAQPKEEVIEDLSAVKNATDQEEPNKTRALARLDSVAETLEKTSKTVESGQKLWSTAKPMIARIARWLGAAAGSHLLGL